MVLNVIFDLRPDSHSLQKAVPLKYSYGYTEFLYMVWFLAGSKVSTKIAVTNLLDEESAFSPVGG